MVFNSSLLHIALHGFYFSMDRVGLFGILMGLVLLLEILVCMNEPWFIPRNSVKSGISVKFDFVLAFIYFAQYHSP